ncbi:O-antigen ligase family protein [Demequina rhizosphaerae]|uniref:O-antigen ligase family protein n=1 Tax=Demequina rhizosphaerae TaxID=1638985 RepID=UPI0014706BE4|nr:O-antigen ligase family protein [Demequina rhizosphaerae]
MIYVSLRVLVSLGQAEPLVWLRDSVPFLYGALALLSAYSLARADAQARARSVRFFRWALTVHMLWVASVSVAGLEAGFALPGPFASAPVLEVRPDIDVALVAIACGLNLRQAVFGQRRFWNIAGLLVGVATVFVYTGTRAGQLSLLGTLALSFAFSYAASHQAAGRRLMMVFTVPIVCAAALWLLPATTAGERLLATVLPAQSEGTAQQVSAAGTQRARELVWSGVVGWTNEENGRALLGSGFGNNFLEQSGTLHYLEGTTYSNVRSPHNWFVGVYARLGIIGITLIGAWVVQLLLILWRRRKAVGLDDLLSFSALAVFAVLPVATFGVVLEAPFGAVPFFWASGIIMAERGISPFPGASRALGRAQSVRRPPRSSVRARPEPEPLP